MVFPVQFKNEELPSNDYESIISVVLDMPEKDFFNDENFRTYSTRSKAVQSNFNEDENYFYNFFCKISNLRLHLSKFSFDVFNLMRKCFLKHLYLLQ